MCIFSHGSSFSLHSFPRHLSFTEGPVLSHGPHYFCVRSTLFLSRHPCLPFPFLFFPAANRDDEFQWPSAKKTDARRSVFIPLCDVLTQPPRSRLYFPREQMLSADGLDRGTVYTHLGRPSGERVGRRELSGVCGRRARSIGPSTRDTGRRRGRNSG